MLPLLNVFIHQAFPRLLPNLARQVRGKQCPFHHRSDYEGHYTAHRSITHSFCSPTHVIYIVRVFKESKRPGNFRQRSNATTKWNLYFTQNMGSKYTWVYGPAKPKRRQFVYTSSRTRELMQNKKEYKGKRETRTLAPRRINEHRKANQSTDTSFKSGRRNRK